MLHRWTLAPVGSYLKEPLEQVFVGFYPKESLIDDHEAHQL